MLFRALFFLYGVSTTAFIGESECSLNVSEQIMSDTGRSPRPAGSQLRQRRGGGAAAASSGRPRAGNSGGLWRFYTEDSTGLKIGPVPVLVMSLVFIASVFVLHIWGKFTRSRA